VTNCGAKGRERGCTKASTFVPDYAAQMPAPTGRPPPQVPASVTPDQVRSIFQPYGNIIDLNIMAPRKAGSMGESCGCGQRNAPHKWTPASNIGGCALAMPNALVACVRSFMLTCKVGVVLL
jgi:hypothetical protein